MMLPWLAHGHVSPFLELAERICRDDRIGLVHFCSTPVNLGPVRDHLGKLKAALLPSSTSSSSSSSSSSSYYYYGDKIRPVELHLLPGAVPPGLEQPHLHTTKHLPPALMPALKQALDLAEPSFCRLLDSLRPDLLIYDFLQPWAPLAAQRRGIPAFHFMTSSAASTAFFCHYSRTSAQAFPFPAIRLGSLDEDVRYAAMLDKAANGLSDRDRFLQSLERSSALIAIKSFPEIESKYIGYLSSLTGKEVVPVGPLVPDADPVDHESERRRLLDRVVGWLGKRGAGSVVFVSFGTEYFMTEEETEELACGLELSGASFIWVVRFPPREGEEREKAEAGAGVGNAATALPRGFLERVLAPAGKEEAEEEGGGRGMVLEGWAPQRSILAHPSVGAFLTHCGWSSVMEGMRFGVPMVALPLHLDQPMNARLVVELGVGAGILPPRRHGSAFNRDDVARQIREVLLPTTERGQGVVSKAKEMAEMMSRKGDAEMQALLKKMVALCRDKRPISREDDIRNSNINM